MKMNTKLAALLCASLLSTGCSVMHFKNGPVAAEGRTVELWHHNLALNLYEVSPPLNMDTLCAGKDWSVVTSKETLASGVAGIVGQAIWYPQIASYTCGK